jgi:superfamily I DNA/RNA helicase
MNPARTVTVTPPLEVYREHIVNIWQKRGWLNKAQLGAVKSVLQLPPEGGLRLIQGPPGTGKTTTVAAIVSALQLKDNLQTKHRILLCAPSNAAVDELLLRLRRDGLLPTTTHATSNVFLREESMLRLGTLENIHGAALPLGS